MNGIVTQKSDRATLSLITVFVRDFTKNLSGWFSIILGLKILWRDGNNISRASEGNRRPGETGREGEGEGAEGDGMGVMVECISVCERPRRVKGISK